MILTLSSRTAPPVRRMLVGCAVMALLGCSNGYDPDLRRYTALGFDTSSAAQQAVQDRPKPDSRGVIAYPNYQVAVAQSGDTVQSVAQRVGVNAAELASYNAVEPAAPLNLGAVLVLPRRVAEPAVGMAGGTGGFTAAPTGGLGANDDSVSITTLASSAIDRASTTAKPSATAVASAAPPRAPARATITGEPTRHKVARGETAYTVARTYNVPVKSLADWNGLPADLSVHEGQILLIPVTTGTAANASAASTSLPGQGSVIPEPPSAATPLPAETTVAAATPIDRSAAPNLGADRSSATAATLAMPVTGTIVKAYSKGRNDGIDISAPAGSAVKAAEAGTVAAITYDTERVPILVLRHSNGLMTVYANVDQITVQKGDSVKRGQTIGKAKGGTNGAVHFEVRKGLDSVDPVPYL